jgi:hypothetical protein
VASPRLPKALHADLLGAVGVIAGAVRTEGFSSTADEGVT